MSYSGVFYPKEEVIALIKASTSNDPRSPFQIGQLIWLHPMRRGETIEQTKHLDPIPAIVAAIKIDIEKRISFDLFVEIAESDNYILISPEGIPLTMPDYYPVYNLDLECFQFQHLSEKPGKTEIDIIEAPNIHYLSKRRDKTK